MIPVGEKNYDKEDEVSKEFKCGDGEELVDKYPWSLFFSFQKNSMKQKCTQHKKSENIPGNDTVHFRGAELIPAKQENPANETENDVFG
jgi:hypothetical protein